MDDFEEDLQIGYIAEYNVGTKKGIVIDPEGIAYTFSGQDIIGTFPILMDRPWVSFNIDGTEATKIEYDPSITERETAPVRGIAILGAAKCPNCDWRIPILPSANVAALRRRRVAACPECGVLLKLKSMFSRSHNLIASVIWIIILLGSREIYISGFDYFGLEFSAFFFLVFMFYAIMLFSFVYLYLQESLILAEEGIE